ncbi:Gfo/Idh/MocA family oxidoreductase [Methylopila sp. M107]|uniref:Gfo/Idh/MocA family protein n=1 Tax=Methylopila sp. M107 TaxID=1101190 RepID=UPI00036960EA|nr:Gfo/Idh/MocA family oxidoreductase [Methylopila sp. M107]
MAVAELTGIAIVGCGYVADSYRECLRLHDGELALRGVWDHDPERLAAFVSCWGDRAYRSIDEVLADRAVEIVVNLTTPEAHAEITDAAIAAGKHVYSEKPLAMTLQEAELMRDKARAAKVRLAAAPCNLLGESAQTLWAAVRGGRIGRPMLAYAELDDGMIHRADYYNWISRSGRPWPARGEFETGCTFEHAGYAITVLAGIFGPVRRVTAFSSLLAPDKRTDPPLAHPAPDFSVGCLEFDDGVVARVTNSVVAPYDHRMRIVGEEGTLEVAEPWDYASPVRLRKPSSGRLSRLIERRLGGLAPAPRLPAVRKTPFKGGRGKPTMDFMRGVAELAGAVRQGRPCRLDEDFAVHITEVTEMLQHPERFPRPALVSSNFAPIAPMEWANG